MRFTLSELAVVVFTILGQSLGIYLLKGIGSGSSDFHFLGITLIVITVASFILGCFFCCILDSNETSAFPLLYHIPLILPIAGLAIFALVVSVDGGGESIPGRSYKEYHLESYSKWMEHKVNAHEWNNYQKNVVIKSHVCNKMIYDYQNDSIHDFYKRSLNPFESGCCKPPHECNFNYTNPISWVKPVNGNYTNNDCNIWDNDVRAFCFNCDSCKAAFLEDVTHHYFITGILFLVVLGIAAIALVHYNLKICYDYYSPLSYQALPTRF